MESEHFNFKLDPVLDADLIKWLRNCRSRNIREALYSYLKSNQTLRDIYPIKEEIESLSATPVK